MKWFLIIAGAGLIIYGLQPDVQANTKFPLGIILGAILAFLGIVVVK